jgi:hypothetical protein
VAVYLLTGEYDFAGTPEIYCRMVDQIKGAQYMRMKGLGHFPVSENYELFKGYIIPALDEIARARTSSL